MTSVSCHYCGLPFRVRRVEAGYDYFCCTGCAMLSRVPVDDKGQYPVNAHVVTALVAGFLFFNQLLFWMVGVLLARDGRAAVAERFFWIAGGVAVAVWLTLWLLQRKERAARFIDHAVMFAGLAMLVCAFRRSPPALVEMALTNVLLIGWSFRGLLRKAVGRKSVVSV